MPDAVAKSRPLDYLLTHYPDDASQLRKDLADMHADTTTSRFLPVQARGAWAAVIDPNGKVLGYLSVDGFV